MPRTYYDDNYGFWDDMDEPENQAFYEETLRRSVVKRCEGCGRPVRIKSEYAYCNSCADKIEKGWDI